jgi:hypothetical protein
MGAGAALTRAAMATTTEILTNILELDPGMQLSRNLGDQLLFIPRTKDGPGNQVEPGDHHDVPGSHLQAPGQDKLGTTGVRTEKRRSPLGRTGSWHVEFKKLRSSLSGQGRWRLQSWPAYHNFMILILFPANDCIKILSVEASPARGVQAPEARGAQQWVSDCQLPE